jgi:hypothetical protein
VTYIPETSSSEDESLQAAVAALIGHFRLPIEEELCAPAAPVSASPELSPALAEAVA